MSDTICSEIQSIYEESARDSLHEIFLIAFGIYSTEHADGYRRLFIKSETENNLWWKEKPSDNTVEMDFVAHVYPLSILAEMKETFFSPMSNVHVFKSSVIVNAEDLNKEDTNYQQNVSSSLEKNYMNDDQAYHNFQYVVAEITGGGSKSVTKKLIQLEKHCFFLCSRACPQAKASYEFNVLKTVAFAAVVAPNIKIADLQNNINERNYPLLNVLSKSGRFVIVEDNRTLRVNLQKIDELTHIVAELSEQNQALDAKISEQKDTLQAMSSQISSMSEQLSFLFRIFSKGNG